MSRPVDFKAEIIKFRKLSKFGKEPSKGTPFSAGFDLFSAEEKIIPAHTLGFVSKYKIMFINIIMRIFRSQRTSQCPFLEALMAELLGGVAWHSIIRSI